MSKVVYFFKMDNCSPCQRIKPIIYQLKELYKNFIQTFIIDINERPEIAAQFGVMATPTTIFMIGNQRVGQVDGGDANKLAYLYKQLAHQ
jgi:thioredoxin-like negative regulator of GroEL